MSLSKAARAVRRFCLDCQGGSSEYVRTCSDDHCVLYPVRLPEDLSGEIRTLRIIRVHCMACAEGRKDVRECEAKESCPLWSFRFGVLPSTFKRVAARRKKERETLKLPGF